MPPDENPDWVPDDPFWRYSEGDDSEMQLNDEGEPRPGKAWKAALDYLSELRGKRLARPKHPGVDDIEWCLAKVRINSLRRLVRHKDSVRRMRVEVSKPPFERDEATRFVEEIGICGGAVVLAWMNEDEAFFSDLARFAKLTFGKHRKKDATNEEKIIEEAEEQWYDGCRNPSREGVRMEIEKKGIKIAAKQWPDYFKRCKLEFLKSNKGPGRPRKPEPLKRFVVEMPKGFFKVHHVTAREGEVLKLRAEQDLKEMAEAEARGEEYIPF